MRVPTAAAVILNRSYLLSGPGHFLKALSSFKWDDTDLEFMFNQVRTRMATAGVKNNFTELHKVKPILRKTQASFPDNNAYKLLKTKILQIFAVKKDQKMEKV